MTPKVNTLNKTVLNFLFSPLSFVTVIEGSCQSGWSRLLFTVTDLGHIPDLDPEGDWVLRWC